MSMKKTDLVKNLAKKLDGRMKSAAVPQRFGKGATPAVAVREKPEGAAAAKPVQVTCRLPADLAARLRDRAVAHEGGVHAIVTQALERWLDEGR